MKQIYICTSEINGKGVFAGEDIKAGEVIQPVEGKMVFKTIKSKKDSLSYPNWIGVGLNQWIDPKKPFKFLNHSCNPNAGAKATLKGETRIIAMKNIKEGEEITLDYAIIEGDPMWELKCSCGEKNCRKIIRSVHFIPPRQFSKYLPYIPRYFQKLYKNRQTALKAQQNS